MKKEDKKARVQTFSDFLDEPHIALAILTFGLIALVLSILEFSRAIGY